MGLWGINGWKWLWPDVREEVLKRDNYKCQICGDNRFYLEKGRVTNLEVHHIKPISQGGKCIDRDNLITLCKACHSQTFNRHHGYAGIPKKQLKLDVI